MQAFCLNYLCLEALGSTLHSASLYTFLVFVKIPAQRFNNKHVHRYIATIPSLYFPFQETDESQGKELLFVTYRY